MAKIWKKRIEAGTQKFSECPERYRAEVLELLRMDVESGIITAELFETYTGMKY